MTPRVLFVTHSGVLGGGELSLLDIARHHAQRAAVVLFADGPFRKRLEREGVATHVLLLSESTRGVRRERPWPSLASLVGVLSAARRLALQARSYELIYANSQKAFVVASFAGFLSRRPVIWHLRDILSEEHFSRTNIKLVVQLANWLVARVIANSQATADAFVRSGGRKDKVRVVHNGIDATPFSANEPVAVTQRAALGIGSAPLVGAFSRLSQWKGQHVLLDALSSLPGVHAIFVGEALFGEESYADELRKRADRLGVRNRVHFLGFREDIPRLMCMVDVVAHTSVSPEPFGRVIVEGMLAGRPVIASRAGGAMEIIRDGVTGVLVEPNDGSALAAAIISLLGTARGARIGAAGQAEAWARFTVEQMLAGVTSVIREIA